VVHGLGPLHARCPPAPLGLSLLPYLPQGSCIIGGHDNHPDFEYFLPWKAGEGQGGWKVCGKCQGLYRQTGNDIPFCPASGLHLPQDNNVNWQELRVMTSGRASLAGVAAVSARACSG